MEWSRSMLIIFGWTVPWWFLQIVTCSVSSSVFLKDFQVHSAIRAVAFVPKELLIVRHGAFTADLNTQRLRRVQLIKMCIHCCSGLCRCNLASKYLMFCDKEIIITFLFESKLESIFQAQTLKRASHGTVTTVFDTFCVFHHETRNTNSQRPLLGVLQSLLLLPSHLPIMRSFCC